MKIIRILGATLIMMACNSVRHADGWYSVANQPENKIEGKAIVTAKDFAAISLDTVSFSNMAVIEGRLKAEKVRKWAEATENRIGKNESIIMENHSKRQKIYCNFWISHIKSLILHKIFNFDYEQYS